MVALGPLRVGEWMRERVLGLSAVWPLVCASVSSDSRPCGRRTLAVWPLDSRRVAWPHLCTLPVPQWCPMVVSLCEDKTTYHGLPSYRGLSGLRATAAGRSQMRRAVTVAVRYYGARGPRVWKQYPFPPGPTTTYMEIRSAAGAVRVIGSSSRWMSGESRTLRGLVKASGSGGEQELRS